MQRSSNALVVVSFCLFASTACKKNKRADEPELPTVTGSGVTASQSRTLAPFTRLLVKGALDVTVNVGKDAPLELSGDDNLFGHVSSKVVNGALSLDSDAVLKPAQTFRLTLGTARLDDVAAAVAAKVTVHGVKSDAFSVRTGGAAAVTADGSSSELSVSARAASRIELKAFSASRCRATASDFTHVELGYLEKLDATQRDYGTIVYRGTPELTLKADRPAKLAPSR